jgi:hypothetical protein
MRTVPDVSFLAAHLTKSASTTTRDRTMRASELSAQI